MEIINTVIKISEQQECYVYKISGRVEIFKECHSGVRTRGLVLDGYDSIVITNEEIKEGNLDVKSYRKEQLIMGLSEKANKEVEKWKQ